MSNLTPAINGSRLLTGDAATTRHQQVTSQIFDFERGVAKEINRQAFKWGVQDHPLIEWYAILAEEVGEIAKAILEGDGEGLKREIHQVGAVLVQLAAKNESDLARSNVTQLHLDESSAGVVVCPRCA